MANSRIEIRSYQENLFSLYLSPTVLLGEILKLTKYKVLFEYVGNK